MKYALINGKILNGHKDMEVETGKTIFIENEKIVENILKKLKLTVKIY